MAKELEAMARARNAAIAAVGPDVPVLIRGDADPGTPSVIILDLIADTARATYGLDISDRLIQVSVYTRSDEAHTATMAKTLGLVGKVRTALRAAGFRYRQTRPAPTPPKEYGYIADFDI